MCITVWCRGVFYTVYNDPRNGVITSLQLRYQLRPWNPNKPRILSADIFDRLQNVILCDIIEIMQIL